MARYIVTHEDRLGVSWAREALRLEVFFQAEDYSQVIAHYDHALSRYPRCPLIEIWVGDQVFRHLEYWFPIRASAERLISMKVEFSLNGCAEEGQPSIAEAAWSTGDIDRAMSVVPSYIPANVTSLMRQLLQPWPAGRYTEAYQRSGGILNLFTPPWEEPQDEMWAGMLVDWKAESFDDAEAREEALRRLEQQWNTTPHPFFAGLSPAQVMVGGGPQEAKLAEEFLERLTRIYDCHRFESEGMP